MNDILSLFTRRCVITQGICYLEAHNEICLLYFINYLDVYNQYIFLSMNIYYQIFYCLQQYGVDTCNNYNLRNMIKTPLHIIYLLHTSSLQCISITQLFPHIIMNNI